MNLDTLRTLVSIVDLGSLSAAGRALHISQPAVSKQIQRLEAELGLPLLLRGPRSRATLTPAGERVLQFARMTLAEHESLERDLAALKEIRPGTLTLAASTIPGEYVLPPLLAAFRRLYPQVQVQMTVSDTIEVVEQLLAGEADVGVVGSHLQRPGLRLERLVGDEIVLAVPAGHPFARRSTIDPTELEGQPMIRRELGSGTRRSVEAALASAGYHLRPEDVALTLGSTQAILQAVEGGLGLGFLSARAATQAERDGRVACVHLAGVDLRRDLCLVSLPVRAGAPLVARFIDFARAQLPADR